MRNALVVIVLMFAAGAVAAVASDVAQTSPSPTPAPTPVPTRAVPPIPPTATGPVAPPAGRRFVAAPIDRLDVRILESAPPRYVVEIQAGLPSGCAQKGRHDVARSGETITITVLNSMPTGDPVCTMIYGTYELSIDLGSDFKRGVTYTVVANDRQTTFTAQ